MTTPTCETCAHFYQHYVMTEQYSTKTNCGHCTRPRCKHRCPDAKACEFYEARTTPHTVPNRGETIRYLTTKVLDHILSLPLPPEIK